MSHPLHDQLPPDVNEYVDANMPTDPFAGEDMAAETERRSIANRIGDLATRAADVVVSLPGRYANFAEAHPYMATAAEAGLAAATDGGSEIFAAGMRAVGKHQNATETERRGSAFMTEMSGKANQKVAETMNSRMLERERKTVGHAAVSHFVTLGTKAAVKAAAKRYAKV